MGAGFHLSGRNQKVGDCSFWEERRTFGYPLGGQQASLLLLLSLGGERCSSFDCLSASSCHALSFFFFLFRFTSTFCCAAKLLSNDFVVLVFLDFCERAILCICILSCKFYGRVMTNTTTSKSSHLLLNSSTKLSVVVAKSAVHYTFGIPGSMHIEFSLRHLKGNHIHKINS